MSFAGLFESFAVLVSAIGGFTYGPKRTIRVLFVYSNAGLADRHDESGRRWEVDPS